MALQLIPLGPAGASYYFVVHMQGATSKISIEVAVREAPTDRSSQLTLVFWLATACGERESLRLQV